MSSMRNAVQRRNHRERAQPAEREKWGILEKHKDYSLRAKDYNEKKKRLQILREKAAQRNPNEFHFGMIYSRTHDKGQKLADRGNPTLSQDTVKLLKTQDAGYLKTMAQKTRIARERIEQQCIIQSNGGDRDVGDDANPKHTRHVYFVDSMKEQQFLDMAHLQTNSSDRHKNKKTSRVMQDEPSEIKSLDHPNLSECQPFVMTATDHIRIKEISSSKQNRTLRKQRERHKSSLNSQLKTLRQREKDLLAAERELALQRARMSNSIGGVTKAGIKWKIRERKR